MKFCTKCGNQLNENEFQCQKCGHIIAGVQNRQWLPNGQSQQINQGMYNGNMQQMGQGMPNGNPQQMGQGMYNGTPQQMNPNTYNGQQNQTQSGNGSKLIMGIVIAAVLGLFLCLSIGIGVLSQLCYVLINVFNTGAAGFLIGMFLFKDKTNERKTFMKGYLITFGVVFFIVFTICIIYIAHSN